MTLSSTSNRNDYIGTGTTGPFPYTFKIFAASDLVVTKKSVVTGLETTLTLTSEYSVSGVGQGSGGSVTLTVPLASGDTLTIRRVRPLTQATSFRDLDAFLPETHEDALDHLVMIAQQQREQLDRIVSLPVSATGVSAELPTPAANKALFWKSDGSGLENRALTASGVVTLPGQGRTVVDLTSYLANNAVINPKDFGAKGDVKSDGDPVLSIAGTCSITNGQAILTSTRSLWSVNDVGKKIVVYGAGPLSSNFRTPLATTILSYQSPTQITLAANASNTVTAGAYTGGSAEGSIVGMTARVAWGTDDTAAIQAAIDALAVWDGVTRSNIGGRVLFPPGRYFTLGIHMYEAVTTSVGVKAYNNITIQGSGAGASALETYDPINGAAPIQGALVTATTDAPSNTPGADWLRGFICCDIELRVVPHNANPTNILTLAAAYDPHVFNNLLIGWSYEGCAFGGHGRGGRFHDNVVMCAGQGGPTEPFSTSGFNMLAAEVICENNKFIRCGQGMEASSHRGTIRNNTFDATGLPAFVSPPYGLNVGSDGQGIWALKILSNTFRGYVTAITISNSIGTVNRITIDNNTIVDGSITFTSGLESNSVTGIDSEVDTVIHGDSLIARTTFLYTKAPPGACITTGPAGGSLTNACLEHVVIKNNTVVTPGMFCAGGTRDGLPANVNSDCTAGGGQALSIAFLILNNFGAKRWLPATAYSVGYYVVPRKSNGYMYKCTTGGTSGAAAAEPAFPTGIGATVNDNGVVWTCFGKDAQVVLEGNTVSGSPTTVDNPASIRLDIGTVRRESLKVISHTQNYPWRFFFATPESLNGDPFDNELVPAGFIYSDLARVSDTIPIHNKFDLQSRVRKRSASTEARCTRAGEAGPVWQAAHVYAYGDRVVAVADNAHIFECIVAGTSAGAEPGWNTGAGATTTDNTVTWKEVGTAVLFGAYA